jgi:hypothetical protein
MVRTQAPRPSLWVSPANQQACETHKEGRGAWVLTIYGISGLALLGVLAYYFSAYITH